jgi:hypothetical protein
LPNFGIVVSLAAFIRLFPDEERRIDKDWGSALKRWYFSRLLRAGARAAANWVIGRDFVDLVKHKREGSPLTFEKVFLSEDAIVDMPEQDNRFKALQCIITSNLRVDVLTGASLIAADVEEHHIFPRAGRHGSARKRKLYDSIVNRTLVLRSTNRKLSNEKPEVYFGRMADEARRAGMLEALQSRLREHLIPWAEHAKEPRFGSRFAEENFEEFARERATLLLRKVREAIGDSLIVSTEPASESDDVEADD